MRTLVDIPDRLIDELVALSSVNKVSRAEIIRRAISAYIDLHRSGADDAFGVWKRAPEDGLAYQKRVRLEW